jgi:hypothetical protein
VGDFPADLSSVRFNPRHAITLRVRELTVHLNGPIPITRSSTPKPALYLDIDGVLLRRTGILGLGGTRLFELAAGARQFLGWAASRFEVFWLSARTADGERANAERAFRHASPSGLRTPAFMDLIGRIRAVPWHDAKINGIDRDRGFLWIDDDPDPISMRLLDAGGLTNRLIRASADSSPNILHALPQEIARRLPGFKLDLHRDNRRNGKNS